MVVESTEYKQAEKKVEAKLGFYKHLAAYVIVNLFLCIINLITSGSVFWAVWPVLVWGLVIIVHAVVAFFQIQSIKEDMIKKELGKGKTKVDSKK